jgi:pimeloyl-ACP methyl ester carboxylesterase
MPASAEAAAELGFYDRGRTTIWACRADPRFSWCAYVPEAFSAKTAASYRLLVAVHGTARGMTTYRDGFARFAEQQRLIVLAPLFPAGITGPDDLSSYKFMRAGDLHYDAILLSMVDEIQAKYRLDTRRFAMFGFSGGGHFAHRFFYLHPQRLSAASIGAPGVVTLLDAEHDFWVGVRNFESVFGRRIDLDAMRGTPVQMVIGGNDTETWEITIKPDMRLWMPGADLAGVDRLERMRSLKASFETNGIAVRHDVVPGIAHEGDKVIPAVEDFFAEALGAARTSRAA